MNQVKQRKKKSGRATGLVILAIFLGICVISVAAADGCLLVAMHKSDKMEAYAGDKEKQQEEDLPDETPEEAEGQSTSATMSGFVAGESSVSAQPEQSQETAEPEETQDASETTEEPSADTEKTATKSNGISNEDYILPESDSKYYTNKDLKKLTRKEVKLARNEIYARHGRKFTVDKSVKKYFEGKSWYKGTVKDVPDSKLNKYEIANRNLIVKYEKKKKWR